jgi:hypothetical protein
MAIVAPAVKMLVLKLMSSPEVPTVQSRITVPPEVSQRAHVAVPLLSADVSDVMAEAVAVRQHRLVGWLDEFAACMAAVGDVAETFDLRLRKRRLAHAAVMERTAPVSSRSMRLRTTLAPRFSMMWLVRPCASFSMKNSRG